MRRTWLSLTLAALVAVAAIVMIPPVAGAQDATEGSPDTTVPPDTTIPPDTTVPPDTTLPPDTTIPSDTTTSTTATTIPPETTTSTTATTLSPPPPPKVKGVGDSVFHSVQAKLIADLRPEYRPTFKSVLGATIQDMTPAARDMVARDPAIMVIGLGNPDMAEVDEPNSTTQPLVWAAKVLKATRDVPCVVWMNLKQHGVNPFYNPHWETDATAFNQWLVDAASKGGDLAYANLHVINWNAATVGHPGWFLADGLHLNETGQHAYANKIDSTLNRICPP